MDERRSVSFSPTLDSTKDTKAPVLARPLGALAVQNLVGFAATPRS
jgi:hypothetical protein